VAAKLYGDSGGYRVVYDDGRSVYVPKSLSPYVTEFAGGKNPVAAGLNYEALYNAVQSAGKQYQSQRQAEQASVAHLFKKFRNQR